MGDYDRILKENIESLLLPLGNKLLGLDIEKMQDLPGNLSQTLERQPDFLKLVTDADGNKYILHLEFQTVNDQNMASRMLTYFALLYEKYRREVRQFVIYLGSRKMTMPERLEVGMTSHAYRIINLQKVSADSLLDAAEQPEEAVLSVLANFDRQEASKVLNRILHKLQELSANERLLKKYIKQLEILSHLRNLQEETIKQSEAMAITYDIKKDVRYQQGKKEGKLEGILEGKEEGEEKKQLEIARNMKKAGMSVEQIAELTGLTKDQIQKL
ncbi:MAG: Rpn family recombination-promoting nuclease/putative transposase [Cyclobacteriaceae bacterium]